MRKDCNFICRMQHNRSAESRRLYLKTICLSLLAIAPNVNAFQTTHNIEAPHKPLTSSEIIRNNAGSIRQKDSKLGMMSWEDVMFNAQSTASSMASVSLDDPSNLMSSVPIMYGAGLLTAFSPCVWGLLPLTISYISTAAGERQDKKIMLPTLSFALGLASVFCSLGLIAASVGGAVYGNSGNTNIVLPIFSNAICCIMGFQLLDLIDIPIPLLNPSPVAKSQSSDEPILIDGSGKILASTKDGSSKTQGEQGSLFRTFLLGGSSALVASPCATPVLASILAFVASSSNPVLGGFLLLFYTLG